MSALKIGLDILAKAIRGFLGVLKVLMARCMRKAGYGLRW